MKTLVPTGSGLKVIDENNPVAQLVPERDGVKKWAYQPPQLIPVVLPKPGLRGPAQVSQLKAAFIKLYTHCGNVLKSAEAIGVNRRQIYIWQEHDEDFARDMADAKVASIEVLEGEVFRRAVEGVPEEHYDSEGNLISVTRKYSDSLLMFTLKGNSPKYRDRQEISGPNGGPLQMGLELLVTLNDRPAPEPNGHSNGHVVEGEVRELGGG